MPPHHPQHHLHQRPESPQTFSTFGDVFQQEEREEGFDDHDDDDSSSSYWNPEQETLHALATISSGGHICNQPCNSKYYGCPSDEEAVSVCYTPPLSSSSSSSYSSSSITSSYLLSSTSSCSPSPTVSKFSSSSSYSNFMTTHSSSTADTPSHSHAAPHPLTFEAPPHTAWDFDKLFSRRRTWFGGARIPSEGFLREDGDEMTTDENRRQPIHECSLLHTEEEKVGVQHQDHSHSHTPHSLVLLHSHLPSRSSANENRGRTTTAAQVLLERQDRLGRSRSRESMLSSSHQHYKSTPLNYRSRNPSRDSGLKIHSGLCNEVNPNEVNEMTGVVEEEVGGGDSGSGRGDTEEVKMVVEEEANRRKRQLEAYAELRKVALERLALVGAQLDWDGQKNQKK